MPTTANSSSTLPSGRGRNYATVLATKYSTEYGSGRNATEPVSSVPKAALMRINANACQATGTRTAVPNVLEVLLILVLATALVILSLACVNVQFSLVVIVPSAKTVG